jgi:hypothetical protein
MSTEDGALAAANQRANEASRRTDELRTAVREAAAAALVRLKDKSYPGVQVQVTKRFLRADLRHPYWEGYLYTKRVAGLFKNSAPKDIPMYGRLYASGSVLVYERGYVEDFFLDRMTDRTMEHLLKWLNALGE